MTEELAEKRTKGAWPVQAAGAGPQEAPRVILAPSVGCVVAGEAAGRPQLGGKAVRLRVLQVVNSLGVGGTEYGVLKIMTHLNGAMFEQRICAMRGVDQALPELPALAGGVFVAGEKNGKWQFPLFRLARIMRAFRPHIVHSRNWGAVEAIPAARLAGVPVAIHSEHGYELEMLSGLPARHRVLRRGLYALADAVFAVTRELRDFHARQAWVSPDKIRVLYNGVDTQRFSPRADVRRRLRKERGIPAGSFLIGSVGRMVPIKDYGTLLRAAEILIRGGLDVRVLLVGSGAELAGLQRYAGGSTELAGRVWFTGAVHNVPELLNAMDAYVLPSICEGMSNTLLEAMASGLPVVATRVGGNPEVVEENRAGRLFSPRDADGLARCLLPLVRNKELRNGLGAAARRRAVERFSLERMLQEYQNLYWELADRRGLLGRN